MKKFLLFVGILVLIGLGALIAYRVKEKLTQKEEMKAKNVAPVTVALADVVKGELADIGNFTGTLEADSLFNISPKTAGRLKTLNFNIGDAVKLNDAVAELDDDEQQQSVNEESAALVVCEAQVKSSQAGVMSAKTQILSAESGVKSSLAQQTLAKKELERHEQLRRDDLNTQAELDSAKATYEVRVSEVDIARSKVELAKTELAIAETDVAIKESQVVKQKAALEAARARLSYTKITAAWEGGSNIRYVADRFVDPGAMLAVNTPIISVVDLSKMRAIVSTVEQDYARLKKGQLAKVFVDAYPNGAPGSKEKYFSGHIVRIAPKIDENARQGRVEIEIKNPNGLLKPGMFVRIEIEFDRHKDIYLIPSAAVVRRNDILGVFFSVGAEPDMKVHFVPIVEGFKTADIIEVKPVKEEEESYFGGKVVTMGNHLLREDTLIRLPRR